MSLIFGAIVPHPPLLIPAIGRDNLKEMEKTGRSFKELEEILYAKKPDTIIVISPHGNLMTEAFTINHSPVLKADFEDFGDLETKLEFKNDNALAYQIRESLETKLPLVLTTVERLDHGVSVPLYYLTRHLPDFRIIPVGYSMLSFAEHFAFGAAIRRVLNLTNKRVAVIASGDLSHRLTLEAPAGFSERGREFDAKLIELLKQKDLKSILKLNSDLVKEAGECGLKSILILLGVLDEINYQPEILSYEAPFGVGYLVANFSF
ncbi:MAG TPA: AmmeMemoRadiSam system protein B [Patescibacteria group bacterium]|nr:AmmeMemoRadiSam system protein B [Patescibacteria group bacterium]